MIANRKRMHVFLSWIILGLSLALFCAAAGEPMSAGQAPKTTDTERGVTLHHASHLLGIEVKCSTGERVGTVQDLVLDSGRNEIAYVAVGRGGFLGIGEKLVAVPWTACRVSIEGKMQPMMGEDSASTMGSSNSPGTQAAQMGGPSTGMEGEVMTPQDKATPPRPEEALKAAQPAADGKLCLRLTCTAQQLDAMPTIDGDRWPDRVSALGAPSQEQASSTSEVTEGQKQLMESRRVSKLLGISVRPSSSLQLPTTAAATEGNNQEGASLSPSQSLGKIKDAVVNVDNGRILYALISLQNVQGHDGTATVAPWSALAIQSHPRYARLSVPDTETLLAFTFMESRPPVMSERSYAQRLFRAYQQQPHWEMLGFVSPESDKAIQQQSPPAQERKPERAQPPDPRHPQSPRGGY